MRLNAGGMGEEKNLTLSEEPSLGDGPQTLTTYGKGHHWGHPLNGE